jgi:TonB-linked SusC/RagA family outer membrane protein
MRSKFKWIFTLLLAFTMQFSFAQEKTVTGVVSDKTGPLPGANVVVKGSNRSAQADFDGKYSIKAKTGEVLVFSFTGYNNSSVTVGAASTYNVTLNDGIKLEEVVVEGYRNTTKATTVVAQTTVNAKTIENRPNASFIQTLQGQVAGLNIMTGTGQPGAKSTVLIRGVGTINGNTDPLYVIDGVPTNGDNFRSLNPNDIESATVLKDASATAVYGNRAANGVIVIKTRRGGKEEGKTKYRYSLNTGFSQLQSAHYSVSDSHQLLKLEQNYGVGRGASLSDAEIDAYPINTNWTKYFFRTAVSKEHSFSVESQGKHLSSYTSVNYLDQEGVLKGTKLNRFTVRNNIDGKSNDEKFRYSTNLSIGFSKNNEAGNLGTGAVNRNYVLGAYTGAPYISPSEYTGSQQVLDLYGSDGTLLYTPLFLIDKMKTFTNNTDETRILGSVEASYEIFKDAHLTSRSSSELVENRFTQSENPISFNALLFVNPAAEFGGFEDVNNRRDFGFTQLWQFDYSKTFKEKHNFSWLLASEFNFNQLNTNNMRQRGLNPLTFVPGTGSGYLTDITAHDFYGATTSVSMFKKSLISYFTTLDYDYDKKFGFVGSLRYDGSSRFIGKRQWGTFWSLGGRWNLNNMDFMKDNSTFQVLKLRASIGATGNERVVDGSIYAGINPPLFADTYSTASNMYNGIGGYAVNLGYQDLHWETTKQADAGLDFEMFKNRLRGTFDWYNRKTIDIFDTAPISPITGQTSLARNTQADVTNTGVEVSLAYDVIRNENFKFTVRANGAYNDNEVNGITLNGGQNISGNYATSNGHQVGEFYVTHYAGVNPLNGELLFQEADGTLTETPTSAATKYTRKSEIPVYQGGFGFDLDYKGFFATTNFTFAQKVWRFDFDMSGLYDPGNIGQFNASYDLLNAWTPTNTNTDVPSLNAVNLGTADTSDRFLRDASYIRLRFLQVGYRVPKKFLEKTFMTNLSFYAQGENLRTWTKWQGFDAESNRASDQYQYPTPKIISFGMDLRF